MVALSLKFRKFFNAAIDFWRFLYLFATSARHRVRLLNGQASSFPYDQGYDQGYDQVCDQGWDQVCDVKIEVMKYDVEV